MSDQAYQIAAAQKDDGRSVDELIATYRAGVTSLGAAVSGMDAEQLRARPIEGMMSTLEVLCHLTDCDQFLADRIKRIAGTDVPLLVGIDATPYLERLHYHERDPELQLRLFGVTRDQLAADLERLPAEAWQRTGVHTESGLVTLRQMVLHATRHLEYHVERIHEKRAVLGL